MALIESHERADVRAVAALIDCNPFSPERVALEAQVLGPAFEPIGMVWVAEGDEDVFDPNLPRLRQRVEAMAVQLRARLAASVVAAADELADYYRVILYLLFLRYEDDWLALCVASENGRGGSKVGCYERFARDVAHFLGLLPGPAPDAAHLFALGFQARRAFHHIFRKIFGASSAAAHLRAIVWYAIFTRNIARYRTTFYNRMADFSTLIIGESGTGKELGARAIALSQYIPFDASTQTFAVDPATGFSAVNLAALNAALIESELFGHRRGAFTGAIDDHVGWFERCSPYGAVFLDEIGELDGAIQVKLLRVLQDRELTRVGETEPRRFNGRVIAATNRDLEQAIAAGRFREDLYYRLCANVIHMPTLREQVAEDPDYLRNLLGVIARRVAGPVEGEPIAEEVHRYVVSRMGVEHAWPGNIRELEQCLRNVIVSGEYRPRRVPVADPDAADELAAALRRGALTAEEMVQRYAGLVYAQTGSLQETARRLGIDWRTVRKLVGRGGQSGESGQ